MDLNADEKLEVERNHSSYWRERALLAEQQRDELLKEIKMCLWELSSTGTCNVSRLRNTFSKAQGDKL